MDLEGIPWMEEMSRVFPIGRPFVRSQRGNFQIDHESGKVLLPFYSSIFVRTSKCACDVVAKMHREDFEGFAAAISILDFPLH